MKPDCLPKKRRQRLCMDRPIWLAALCVLRVLSHGRAANVTPARPRVRPSADWTSCYTRFAGIDGRALARAAIKRCSQNIIPDARLAVSRRHLHQDRFDLRARRDSISAPRPGTRPVQIGSTRSEILVLLVLSRRLRQCRSRLDQQERKSASRNARSGWTIHPAATHVPAPACPPSEYVLRRQSKHDLTDRLVVQYPPLPLLCDRVDVAQTAFEWIVLEHRHRAAVVKQRVDDLA